MGIDKPSNNENSLIYDYDEEELADESCWPLMLLSDTLIYNENGYPDCSIDALLAELSAKTGVSGFKHVAERSTIEQTLSDGFNMRWRAPKPVERCLSKGSVIALCVGGLSDDSRKTLLSKLCDPNLRLGHNCEVGLGKVCIAPISDYSEFIVKDYERKETVEDLADDELTKKWNDLWSAALRRKAHAELKRNTLTEIISFGYLKNLYDFMRYGEAAKNLIIFLKDCLINAEDFEKLEELLRIPVEKKESGKSDRTEKPYTKLLDKVIDNNKSLDRIARSLLTNMSINSDIPHVINELTGDVGERYEFYRFALLLLCKRTLAERRDT